MRSNPYESLAEAIVTRAVLDYKNAKKFRNSEAISNLERFFKSDYFCLLIDLDGEDVLNILRRK